MTYPPEPPRPEDGPDPWRPGPPNPEPQGPSPSTHPSGASPFSPGAPPPPLPQAAPGWAPHGFPGAPAAPGELFEPVGPGSIRQQDAETARPRPRSAAENRARRLAGEERERQYQAEAAAAAKKKRNRRRLIGGAAVVGAVGLVAGIYLLAVDDSGSDDAVTAYCVNEQNEEVPDSYCNDSTRTSTGTFIYAGVPYFFYYGGTPGANRIMTGGSRSLPANTTVTTRSGTTVQRGGIGSKSGSKSGGS